MPKSFSLVWVDSEPLLALWRERCARLREEHERVLENTRSFREEALPTYRAWVAREYGVELTALRELEESLTRLNTIHLATDAEALLRGKGYPAAYQAVMARRRAGQDLFPRDFGSADDDVWNDGWAEVDPFTDYRGEMEKDPQEVEDSLMPETPPLGGERIRTLYRKLAFALHPDVNPRQTARHVELWSEVQQAYNLRDMARLEILSSLAETGDQSDFLHVTQISALQTLLVDQTHKLRMAAAAFHRLRKDPAWRFWNASKSGGSLASFSEEIESALLADYLKIRRKIDHHEALFRKWATGSSQQR